MKLLAAIAVVLVSSSAHAQPVDPPPGAPRLAVASAPTLSWFGVQIQADHTATVVLQLSAPIQPVRSIQGNTLVIDLPGVSLDPAQRWNPVDLRSHGIAIERLAITRDREAGGARLRLAFAPGTTIGGELQLARASDGHHYVWLRLPTPGAAPSAPGISEPVAPSVGAPPPVAPTSDPYWTNSPHRGWWLQLDLGVGIVTGFKRGERDTELSLAGGNFGFGKWLDPRTALGIRMSLSWLFIHTPAISTPIEVPSQWIVAQYLTTTLSVQRYLTHEVWAAAGLGVQQVYVDGTKSDDLALAASLRLGYDSRRTAHGAWQASLELTPALYSDDDDTKVVSIAGVIGWQLD